MKVVTLSSKDSFGGAAKVAYRLYRSLLNKGVNNLFLVNNKRLNDPSVVRASSYYGKHGFLYNIIHKLNLKYKEKNRIKKWDVYLDTRRDVVMMDLEISLLQDVLNKLQFDLLHLHWVGESYVNFTEFDQIKSSVIWTLHDCFPFTGICTHFEDCYKFETHCGACPQLGSDDPKDYSFKVFEQKLNRYKNIDFHIVCPSNWLAENARKSALLGKYPISVIPNGIDTDFFYPIPKKDAKSSLGIEPDKKVILFGGVSVDNDARKGGELLLKALSDLKSIHQSDDIELLVFGTDSLNIDFAYHTTLLGYIDNEKFMRIVYSAADILIVPSMYENLPTVIMEGLSCGTPVAAFDIGGNSDMIDHGKNGYLASPYDTEDLAKGIKFCLDHNNDYLLSKNAREKIVNHFDIENVSQKYLQLYTDLVSEKNNKAE